MPKEFRPNPFKPRKVKLAPLTAHSLRFHSVLPETVDMIPGKDNCEGTRADLIAAGIRKFASACSQGACSCQPCECSRSPVSFLGSWGWGGYRRAALVQKWMLCSTGARFSFVSITEGGYDVFTLLTWPGHFVYQCCWACELMVCRWCTLLSLPALIQSVVFWGMYMLMLCLLLTDGHLNTRACEFPFPRAVVSQEFGNLQLGGS